LGQFRHNEKIETRLPASLANNSAGFRQNTVRFERNLVTEYSSCTVHQKLENSSYTMHSSMFVTQTRRSSDTTSNNPCIIASNPHSNSNPLPTVWHRLPAHKACIGLARLGSARLGWSVFRTLYMLSQISHPVGRHNLQLSVMICV
jgi:hypothetical protein